MFQRLQQSKMASLPIVLIIQLILVYWVYQPFFTQGEEVVFCANHDGLKNYFTYFTYLTQDENTTADFYTQMQYPYGEYVFYTDNTPSLAVLLKWFSDNIFNVTPYAFRIFNWFCLFGFVLSTLFSWLILNRLTKHIWLWSILTITLPWLTSQIFRLGAGHFNLSFSWTFLAVFYVLIHLYNKHENWQKVLKISLVLWILVYFISFIHLYYLPMLCVIVGMFGFVLAIWKRKNRQKLFAWLGFSFGLPLLMLLSVWGTIRVNDTFYGLRDKIEDAYNWTEWSLKVDALYTSYDLSTIPFFIKSSLAFDYETRAYLGSFLLYGFLFLVGWLMIKTIKNRKTFIPTFKTYFLGKKGKIALLIFFAGLMCFNVAIGEYAKMFNNNVSFDNPFHPFRIARMIAGEVTQFRILARFNWVVFWTFNLTLIYLFDQFFDRHKQIWTRSIIVILTLFSVVDMLDMQEYAQRALSGNPLTKEEIVKPVSALLEGIETDKYQAILPIPFYTVGSEMDEMTVMAEDNWRTRTFMLSIQTGLPLMASNLSRSAIVQHELLLSIFTEKGIHKELKDRLDERPILVFMTSSAKAWDMKLGNKQANDYLKYGQKVPKQYNMKLLKTSGKWQLFEWSMK